jgi:hypothetical protein
MLFYDTSLRHDEIYLSSLCHICLHRIYLVHSGVLVQKDLCSTFTAMSVWMTMSVTSLPVAVVHATTPMVVIVVDALMATSLTLHSPSAYK